MKKDYILITPAYNEERNIEGLIKSVIGQTILPQKWIIVDDGSTDRTGEIVAEYESQHDFMSYLRLERGDIESYYSRRVYVVLAGYEKIKNLRYDFIGVLDADITAEPTYFEQILREFDKDPRLGIAAGAFLYEINGRLQKVLIDELCTPGSNHIFRHECYEQIGGYVPLKYGGDDSLADIMARMHGWKTRNFQEYSVVQHRPVGTGDGRSILRAKFRQGLTEYGIATHPVFMLAKSLRRAILEKPYFVGSLARLAGFLYGHLLREERRISPAAIEYVHKEQMERLLTCLLKPFKHRRFFSKKRYIDETR